MNLKPYEAAVLLRMYEERIIGKAGYRSIEMVRSKIGWQNISGAYKTRKSFGTVARRLVGKGCPSDDGKSMRVLYLDKLGYVFVSEYLERNPNASEGLDDRLAGRGD